MRMRLNARPAATIAFGRRRRTRKRTTQPKCETRRKSAAIGCAARDGALLLRDAHSEASAGTFRALAAKSNWF